jgi:predicted ATPase
MAALLTWFMAGSRTQPAVLAVEDLHWADPTTPDVLRGFAERRAPAPFLVLATTELLEIAEGRRCSPPSRRPPRISVIH